jgi:uncharacterized protein (TIGR00369 family)
MRITAAVPGRVNFELPIEKQHTNRLGILHGATIATMVDTSGSLALASRGLFSTGVSTDINVTYLNSGGKVGDTIRGEVVCDKCESRHHCRVGVPIAYDVQLERLWHLHRSNSSTRTTKSSRVEAIPSMFLLLGRMRKTLPRS